ncbi:uncharacterized protein BP5553_01688 [Venustampulla echinocandica]|uniref:F-box domain-containing protein n=1 Tax=Venustampulla echinocandica TaxID=2656787 RepID=A0A370U1P8_9HELO|nr:uncharacterized protein BP5553_01688 [Venustampulla echinocandica]RDL41709.1 hypothetical protein BP5553_01688 [Venustampulla echinocandica]
MADHATSPSQPCQTTHDEHKLPLTLLQLLSNTVIIYQSAPYLPVYSLLALGATSKAFQSLIHHTPGVFRHLDLTRCKAAQFDIAPIDHGGEVWRNVQLDENLTEDDFYGGPLLGIFHALRRQNILQDVHTLILDGLSVTSDLVQEIICHDSFNVRILSIQNVRYLNERKLQQVLRYVIRPTRPPNVPRLEGLYLFGTSGDMSPTASRRTNPLSASGDSIDTEGGGAQWYGKRGRVVKKSQHIGWASTIMACRGIISFDTVACNGPRHWPPVTATDGEGPIPWYRLRAVYVQPQIAVYAVGGCCKCNTAPEGLSEFGKSPLENFPLLAPHPLHTSTVRSAKTPTEDASDMKLLVRCIECLRNRYCDSCHKWWCEDCYETPEHAPNDTGPLHFREAGENMLDGNQPTAAKVYTDFSFGLNWKAYHYLARSDMMLLG